MLFSGGQPVWLLCALFCAPISLFIGHVRVFDPAFDRRGPGEVLHVDHQAGRKPGTGPGKTNFDVIDYRYRDAAGVEHNGTSYSDPMQLAPGAKVQVEYVERTPSISRIVGTETRPGTPLILLVFLLPIGFALAGLYCMLPSKRKDDKGQRAELYLIAPVVAIAVLTLLIVHTFAPR
jgi:hypothetical protein